MNIFVDCILALKIKRQYF